MKKSALLATTLLLSGTGLAAAQAPEKPITRLGGLLPPAPGVAASEAAVAPASLKLPPPSTSQPMPNPLRSTGPTPVITGPTPAVTTPVVTTPVVMEPGQAAASQPAPGESVSPFQVLVDRPAGPFTEDGNAICCEPGGYAFWKGNRFWLHADYLLWWVKKGPNETPLLTTGTEFQATPGAIGEAGTKVLYGGSPLKFEAFSGLQVAVGGWLKEDQSLGLELRAYVLEQKDTGDFFKSTDNGEPFLLRPFLNAQDNQQDVAILSFPGLVRGQIQFAADSQFWGTEANVICGWVRGTSGRIDALLGFRYLSLNEKIRIDEHYAPLNVEDNPISFGGGSFEFPDTVSVFDQFKVRNQFYGPQIGARTELNFGKCYVDARVLLAMGVTHSKSMVNGGSYLYDGNGNQIASLSGGLLAQKTNIGGQTSDGFTVVPNFIIRTGCNLTDSVRFHVGYNFIYWSNLLRPGDQIDGTVDPRLVPTFQEYDATFAGSRPRQPLKHGDFWAQGLEFGLELRY